MSPHTGYKQSPAHRRRIAKAMAKRTELVKQALEAFSLNKARPRPKPPDPKPTPIPPSASKIIKDLPQRWGAYSHHVEGRYYYKREQAGSLDELRTLIRKLELDFPLWTYVKNGHTDQELTLPIRIPEEATKVLGHRWHQLKEKKT